MEKQGNHFLKLGRDQTPTRLYRFKGRQKPERPAAPATLLSLHMLGMEGPSFKDLAGQLPSTVELITFDQRGHGERALDPPSSFEDFVGDARRVLHALEQPAVHMLGCSMGGSVAALLAAESEPGLIASLSLVATPYEGHPVFSQRARAQQTGSLEPAISTTMERWFGEDPPSQVVGYSRQCLRRMTLEGYDACWNCFAEFKVYEAIPIRFPPTLCVAFGNDLSTPPEELSRIRKALNQARVPVTSRIIPGAGHAGLLTHASDLAPILQEHLFQNQP